MIDDHYRRALRRAADDVARRARTRTHRPVGMPPLPDRVTLGSTTPFLAPALEAGRRELERSLREAFSAPA